MHFKLPRHRVYYFMTDQGGRYGYEGKTKKAKELCSRRVTLSFKLKKIFFNVSFFSRKKELFRSTARTLGTIHFIYAKYSFVIFFGYSILQKKSFSCFIFVEPRQVNQIFQCDPSYFCIGCLKLLARIILLVRAYDNTMNKKKSEKYIDENFFKVIDVCSLKIFSNKSVFLFEK